MRLMIRNAAIVLGFAATMHNWALATVIPVPPDLSPGDQYRLLFVTDSQRDAESTDIADYNAFVSADAAAVAELNALGATWTAMASTPTVEARDNTGTDPTPGGPTGVPIYLVDGTRLANNYDDLWFYAGGGPLLTPPNVTASGAVTGQSHAWTGTGAGGTQNRPLGGTVDGNLSYAGTPANTSVIYLAANRFDQSSSRPLYGISSVLTVPCIENITQGTSHVTIQDAIDTAANGDVIELGVCTFNEWGLTLSNKDLTIRGQGRNQTYIDGNYQGLILDFTSGDQSVFEDLTVRHGLAESGLGGAAARASGSSPTFRNVDFVECDGNGLAFGVILNAGGGLMTFDACRFTGNFGAYNAQVYGYWGDARFINCLFVDTAFATTVLKGSVNSTLDVAGCTFANNSANSVLHADGTGTVNSSVFDGSVNNAFTGGMTASRNLYPGATGDNIDGIPTFVDAVGGNYRLVTGSLGTDAAAYDAYVNLGGGATDLDGASRTIDTCTADTGIGALTYMDMGAYETFDPSVWNVTQAAGYSTIQAALDAANNFDVINLAACVFYEDNIVWPNGVNVFLQGAGRDQTIIDGGGGTDSNPIFYMVNTGQTGATTITDMTLRNGVSDGSFNDAAGAVRMQNVSPEFGRVNFIDNGIVNSATVTAAHVSVRGAGSSPRFANCMMSGAFGGSVSVRGRDALTISMVQCLVVDDTQTNALRIDGDVTANLTNCTVVGANMALNPNFSTLNLANSIIVGGISLNDSPIVNASRSLFAGATGDNIDGAPTFVDAAGGDYRLAPGSLGIDAADTDTFLLWLEDIQDLNGDPRFVDDTGTADTGLGNPTYLDMGPFEFQGTSSLIGDLNCDGVVDLFDIDPFVLALTSAGDTPPFDSYYAVYPDCDPLLADVNDDGTVDLFDIDPFVALLSGP